MMTNPIPNWRRVDLLEWAFRKFPFSPKSKFNGMKKDQLWAIWFSSQNKNSSLKFDAKGKIFVEF
tara:strand:+ start:5247 stop:5441 length:195 start_codon:yes stop_codon:yes gene_type:complete